MAKKKKSAKKSDQADTLQPSWAAHELCALALTLVLALWVVVKYGKQTQPPPLNSTRAKERAGQGGLQRAVARVLTPANLRRDWETGR